VPRKSGQHEDLEMRIVSIISSVKKTSVSSKRLQARSLNTGLLADPGSTGNRRLLVEQRQAPIGYLLGSLA
jgi:hypothetical protein